MAVNESVLGQPETEQKCNRKSGKSHKEKEGEGERTGKSEFLDDVPTRHDNKGGKMFRSPHESKETI